MYPAYSTKLGLRAKKIDIGVQKIDKSYLDIFGIVIADYSVKNKLERVQFFQKTFLLANIGLEVVLRMHFLTFSKVHIRFVERELVWRTYMVAEALPTTRRVEIIDKTEFAAAALNADDETFVVHVAALRELTIILIYPSCQTQVATLTNEETGILIEYFDFSNFFFQTLQQSYQSTPELMITLSIC